MANNNIKELAAENANLKKQIEELQQLLKKDGNQVLADNAKLAEENVKLTAAMAESNQKNENQAELVNKLSTEIINLKKQISDLQSGKPMTSIKGFMLDVDDPFGEGAIADYRKAGGSSVQVDRLPFVLPEKEEASKKAIKMYIVRASAASDAVRVKAAEAAK
jgi:hypothetical protein